MNKHSKVLGLELRYWRNIGEALLAAVIVDAIILASIAAMSWGCLGN